MASFALFNFEFEPIQNKLRQAELKGMESVLMSASEAFPRKQEIFGDILLYTITMFATGKSYH